MEVIQFKKGLEEYDVATKLMAFGPSSLHSLHFKMKLVYFIVFGMG
jgi:hypothetical protein